MRKMSLQVMSVLALVVVAARSSAAQAPDTARVRCTGQTITAIDIRPYPPGLFGRATEGQRQAMRRLVLQSTTRERIIRAFLLTRVGEACSERLLAELARVLRSQPYIGSASVRASSDTAGGVRLTVETTDEIPLIIGGGFGGGGVSNLTFGNGNIAGLGLQAVGRWRQGDAYRDGFSLGVRKNALFDRPLVLALDAVRNPLGDQTSFALTKPFLSDLQHTAWHLGGLQSTTYRRFVRSSGPALLEAVDRDVFVASAMIRRRWRANGMLVGPVLAYERTRPDADAVIASDSGLIPADTNAVAGRYALNESFRIGAAGGFRSLAYTVVRGFDALLGEQDIARGFQIGAVMARGIGAFGATDRDPFLSLDVYSGAGTEHWFTGVRIQGEGVRSDDSWRAVVVSGRAAWYVKASESRTLEASTEFSGGWRERVPLQLSLGEARAGVRGYKDAPISGGRRAILRLENRKRMGRLGRFAALGVASFVDIGKTWSGDVPFGETTVARASIGSGLLVAVPPTSRRTIRLDLAVPVTGESPQRLLFRVAVVDATRAFWREPRDIAAVRAAAPAAPIFGWP